MMMVMHVHMIGVVLILALLIRWFNSPSRLSQTVDVSWEARWQSVLTAFVVPPLLLLTTAVAILVMGERSCHAWEGLMSYGVALLFVAMAAGSWATLAWRARSLQKQVRQYPQRSISTGLSLAQHDSYDSTAQSVTQQLSGHLLNLPTIFSARVGLWSSDLVVTEGLLTQLDAEHIDAVLAHECGHAHYRDTFWFFWLGGLKQLTCWLPYSEWLWQELLLLREMRADRWAVQHVDPLVLAESLVSVVSSAATSPLTAAGSLDLSLEAVCASFSCAASRSRLAQRIDALLNEESLTESLLADVETANDNVGEKERLPFLSGQSPLPLWTKVAIAMTPLLTIPFHH